MSKKQYNIIDDITNRVMGLIDEFDEDMDRQLEGLDPDLRPLRKPDVRAFARYMLELYPPQWWVHPDGKLEFNSIWTIELRDDPRIRGGKELFRQMQKGIS